MAAVEDEGPSFAGASCPLPITDYPHVLMAHGGGGRLMNDLIEKVILPVFSDNDKRVLHDAAVFLSEGKRLAFTSDSFVVNPLFFPGGDIGILAVNGTVNDLAMSGARPIYLSCSLIIEEGLPMERLWRVLQSVKKSADNAEVTIITGDTKVVERGKGDGIFINTSGIGVAVGPDLIAPVSVQVGDSIIVSGDVGAHGMSIMTAREGLSFESEIQSDTACLWPPVNALLEAGIRVHCLRDLTRGGLASALNEIAAARGCSMAITESAIPVQDDVQAACEVLGLDPLYVACEGRFVAFVSPEDTDEALSILKRHDCSLLAEKIGEVIPVENRPLVIMKSLIGSTRIVDMISGEQLPRIC